MLCRNRNYEEDTEAFPADAYKAAGWGAGIAWRVLGWETESVVEEEYVEEDEEGNEVWFGGGDPEDVRTGKVTARMVGDDRNFSFDPEDLTPLDRADYCGVCGQVGCGHDGYDRDEEDDA
jgi:hypothetical protein